jgi:hypothetical protein
MSHAIAEADRENCECTDPAKWSYNHVLKITAKRVLEIKGVVSHARKHAARGGLRGEWRWCLQRVAVTTPSAADCSWCNYSTDIQHRTSASVFRGYLFAKRQTNSQSYLSYGRTQKGSGLGSRQTVGSVLVCNKKPKKTSKKSP